MNNEKYCIAGSKTPEDWHLLKQRLIENSCEETWKEALNDYFLKQLYLEDSGVRLHNFTFFFYFRFTFCELVKSDPKGTRFKNAGILFCGKS